MTPQDARRDGALAVWSAARAAAGQDPGPARTARVREKLAHDQAFLVVLEQEARVVAMALAEPARAARGAGEVVPGAGHVSMVFVHPEHQGTGLGRAVMGHLVAHPTWCVLSLWTRESNVRAQRLYASAGFRPTGETDRIRDGATVQRWRRGGSAAPG